MGVCVLQVTLAYESIVLYMCEGKVLMGKFFFKTYSTPYRRQRLFGRGRIVRRTVVIQL